MRYYIIGVFVFFLISSTHSYAQSYGLKFSGNETIQEKRTGLDLKKKGAICLNNDFELSFDISFVSGHKDYFGYIFRIIENDKQNIDLLYDSRVKEDKHFKLIIGDKVSDIAFDIPLNDLLLKWHLVNIRFDKSKNHIVFKVAGKEYRQAVEFSKNSCFKVFFGANSYKQFKVTDVAAMKIKDIKIKEDGGKKYHWPLSENSGTNASEVFDDNNALVTNPYWIKKMHYEWEKLKSIEINGVASVAFDKNRERLFLIGKDSMITYSIYNGASSDIKYNNGSYNLLRGNQSYYNNITKGLFNFYIDQKLVSHFNFENNTWDNQYVSPADITNYWHPNKFYSTLDSSFYMIGGYGQFTYHKDVLRYNQQDKSWNKVSTTGDFTPRYLSGLGATKSGAYIFGGYGSATGQQIANPKNLYDLIFYDINAKTFKKVLDFNKVEGYDDFVFANSVIIDEKEKKFHALIFPNHNYNSHLQLVVGSLDRPEIKKLGNQIPFVFYDINSFVDLFYCELSQKFIAVVLFYDIKRDVTTANFFSLSSPALGKENEFFMNTSIKAILFGMAVVLILALLIYFVYWKKRKNKSVNKVKTPDTQIKKVDDNVYKEPLSLQSNKDQKQNNLIYLFGDFQVFDQSGNDITRLFTPLLRELFLAILLYSIRKNGISSEKLTEILWFDKSLESARNNRSVNVAKLKTILESVDGCELSKKTGYWKLDIDENLLFVDYLHYIALTKSHEELTKEEKIQKLSIITQKGMFLANIEYMWLDSFKSDVSNDAVDTYLEFLRSINVFDDPEFLIKIANYINSFDSVNEEAMNIKCKALVFLGKHSLAKTTYENFKKEYRTIYQEEYSLDFQTILDE